MPVIRSVANGVAIRPNGGPATYFFTAVVSQVLREFERVGFPVDWREQRVRLWGRARWLHLAQLPLHRRSGMQDLDVKIHRAGEPRHVIRIRGDDVVTVGGQEHDHSVDDVRRTRDAE